MKNFISMQKAKISKNFIFFISILIWLVIWHVASVLLKQEILLVSPVAVLEQLFVLVKQAEFWQSIFNSFFRVISGFIGAIIFGLLLSCISYRFFIVKAFLEPFMAVIKAVPVASYVILCLFFVSTQKLSSFISFITVFPVIYTNILKGLENMDKKLLEMAKLFNIGFFKRCLFIYNPQILPFFISACSISLGICWKAGVAAEVIGLPDKTIGQSLYQAKVFLDVKTLLAWSVVVVFVSFLFEKVFLRLLKALGSLCERV